MADLRARAAAELTDDVPAAALLAALPPEQAGAVERLLDERDHLVFLHEALLDVERADSLQARLRIFVDALRRVGFGWVSVTVHDAELRPAFTVGSRELAGSGADAPAASDEQVWRGGAELEACRVSRSYLLDRGERGGFRLVVPLRARDGRPLATLTIAEAEEGRRPSLAGVRTAELFGMQIAHAVEQTTLAGVAERRAERLQRLQAAGVTLARSLDEREIVRELARQVTRVVPCDGVVIARPDVEAGRIETLLHLVDDEERTHPPAALGAGAIAEVARTGRAVSVDDYHPARSPLAAADDVVRGQAEAGSVLAVPMLAGIRLAGVIAVHHSVRGVYAAEEQEVLSTVAAQAATAFANARLFAESERERRQSEALAEIARAVGESLRLGEVLHLILRHAMALIRTEGGSLALLEGEYLNTVAAVGCGELLAGMYVPVAGSMSGVAVRTGTYFIANDTAANPLAYRPTQRLARIEKTLIVPLITASGAIGVISVFNRAADFTADDARVLQRLADLVGVAIVNARLFGEAAEATREWAVAFDAMASGLAVLDEEGRVTRCNTRAAQLAGRAAPAEVVGREFHDALLHQPGADGAAGGGPVARALAGAAARGVLRAGARGLLFDVVASPHPHGGAVVTFDDVTSHHTLAERYRLVVETTSDAIVITDSERRIAFANPAALQLFGAGGDVTGMPVATLVPPELRGEVRAREDRAMAGEPQRYEAELLRLDGGRRYVSISTAPLRDVEGVTGVVASLRDVTEERRARDAAARSEERYSRLVESASDAIFTLDAAGRFTSVNRALERGIGLAREALLGTSLLEFVAPDERDEVEATLRRALAGERQRTAFRYQHGSDLRLVSLVTAPIVEDGRTGGVLGIARDVTEERALAEQMLQHEKLAAIGQLVSGVAHELNNPLAGVSAFAQILLASPGIAGEERQAVETIHHEARRAAKIVSNLLTFARRHQPERTAADLNQVLLDTLELRRYAIRMAQIELVVELDEELPLTWADPFQLQQVALNLITNAEQALAEWTGPRRMVVRSRHAADTILITVADTGAGIAPADLPRVFNPFYTTKPVGEGTGLGLSISDGIVREHGGRMRVESALGRGATFSIELPVVDPVSMVRASPRGGER